MSILLSLKAHARNLAETHDFVHLHRAVEREWEMQNEKKNPTSGTGGGKIDKTVVVERFQAASHREPCGGGAFAGAGWRKVIGSDISRGGWVACWVLFCGGRRAAMWSDLEM